MKLCRLAALLALLALPAAADTQPLPFPLVSWVRTHSTIASGGVAQLGIPANQGRKAFCVQNPVAATESLWIDFGQAAVVGESWEVAAGAQLCFGQTMIYQGYISVNATTMGHSYSIFEGS